MTKFKLFSVLFCTLCVLKPVLLESPIFNDTCINKAPSTKVVYSKDQPKPDQRSLLLIFDTTGSMNDDLEQMKSGAEEIVKDFSSRPDNPIHNYILVAFDDPGVGTPYITTNVNELLQRLKLVSIVDSANYDCPELSMGGLKAGLNHALPNSIVYLFTDAGAKDYYLFDDVAATILKKQATVNFLVTKGCTSGTKIEQFLVYNKVSQISNGQVFEMEKSNVRDVLTSLRDNINQNYAVIKTYESKSSGQTTVNFDIDSSIYDLKVIVNGKNPRIRIINPSGLSTGTNQLTLDSIRITSVKNPSKGSWKVEANADTAYNVIISGLSNLKVDFGFSVGSADNQSQTAIQPLSGNKNILSLFVSNSTEVKALTEVALFTVPQSTSDVSTEYKFEVKKKEDNLYATDPFDIPNKSFKIKMKGQDKDDNTIERIVSSALVSSPGTAPEITLRTNKVEIYENGNLELRCVVKSLIPVDIAWTYKGQILNELHSVQSNELSWSIQNITSDKSGIYKCVTLNQVSCETQEIRITVKKWPHVKIASPPSKLLENSSSTINCQIDDTNGEDVEYSWIDENGKILQKDSNAYTFTPTFNDDKKTIKCQAKSSDFFVENTIKLNVNYPPKFLSNTSTTYLPEYGSKIKFDCSTTENPSKNSVKWFFTPKGSSNAKIITSEKEEFIELDMYEKIEGDYECAVRNEIGESRKKFTAHVVPKASPKLSSSDKLVMVKNEESIHLFCDCNDCLPVTNYSWILDNSLDHNVEIVKNETLNNFRTILQLNDVAQNYKGNISCTIENSLGEDQVDFELKGEYPPKINKILLNNKSNSKIEGSLEAIEGMNLTFDCIAEAHPMPVIHWFKNDKVVLKGSKMILNNISIDDDGTYDCTAENYLGSYIKSIDLVVKFSPRRDDDAETTYMVTEGNKALLDCNLIGNPSPNISWYINSKNIEGNKKFEINGTSLLFEADADDSAIYSCTGVNNFGSSTIEFPLVVKTFPKIISSNDELIKVEHNTYTKLTCDATGFPKPTIKFIINGKVISNDTFYQITSAKLDDSGDYHCIAENEVGTDEKIFYVAVVKRPLVTTHFSNVTLFTNQTRELTCMAEGIPDPKIKWIVDDKETLSSNTTLNLDSSLKNGKVSCVAENLQGSDEQYFYLETVNKPNVLSIIDELLRNISVREGGNLDLLCPYENYNFIEWHFNGNALNITEYNQIGRKLYVFNAKKSLAGTWTCVVSNSEGSMDFSYDVKILSSPVVLASWKFNNNITDFDKNDANIDQRTFDIGENLLLNCTVDGSPIPSVEWRRGKDLIGRGEVLSIDNLQFYHSDIYSCSAENDQGIVKKYFIIDVLAPPHIDDTLDVQRIIYTNLDDSEALRCNSIIANPEPLFIWIKNDKILDGEEKDHLIIEKVKLYDEGKYRCIGRNKFGSAQIDFDFNIYEPANVVQVRDENINRRESDLVEVSCIVRGFPLPVVSWTFNGHIYSTTSKVNVEEIFQNSNESEIYLDKSWNQMKFIDSSRLNEIDEDRYAKLTRLDKKTLQLNLITKNTREIMHKRKFVCYTFNELGQNGDSIEITVRQKPFIDKQNMPKNSKIAIFETLPLQLSCLIDGFPKPSVTWFKNGQEIFSNQSLRFSKDNRILNIPETTLGNTGNYTCIGKNDDGYLELKFDVQILSPPKFTYSSRPTRVLSADLSSDSFETVNVIEGDDTTLECHVEASPQPEIHWIKINDFGHDEERFYFSEKSSKLVLKSVRKSSVYMCYANNTIGNVEKFFHLNIQHPPEFIENKKDNEDLIIKLHHSLKLDCKVKASPAATTYWSFDSKNISELQNGLILMDNNQTLQISDISMKHEGKFTCTSFNSIGKVQKSFLIKVEIPYTEWSKWSECSKKCGSEGIQIRTRTCILPVESLSSDCPGETSETRKCNQFQCPINGGLSSWSGWSKCPACYDALQKKPKQRRTRKCNSPTPAHGGLKCKEKLVEERECKINVCRIDGGWSKWSDWETCPLCHNSSSSEKPKQKRQRYCNSPIPAHGGLNCKGSNIEERFCNINPCPIDGKWNLWSDWSECPACYDANDEEKPMQVRNRTCNAPEPAHGGLECQGSDIEQRECEDIQICSINGGWSSWSDWGKCPSCYTANTIKPKHRRTRFCNSPSPAYGGSPCEGSDVEEEECKDSVICPIHGGWSRWTSWTQCPSCNDTLNPTNKIRRRFRRCNSPIPAHGGRNCAGKSVEEEDCEVSNPCPINGGWSKWTDWSQCSEKCGPGVNTRIRFCKNPAPMYDGKECDGEPIQTKPCNLMPCPKTSMSSELNLSYDEIENEINYCRPGYTYNSKSRRCEDVLKCKNGYLYNSLKHSCEDIDECKMYGKSLCKLNEICVNIIGGFHCQQIR